jgi:hypothetical protein
MPREASCGKKFEYRPRWSLKPWMKMSLALGAPSGYKEMSDGSAHTK